MKTFLSASLFAAIMLSVPAYAANIAVIGINCDNPDDFAFVALENIDAGTQIYFTDNGVNTDGSFRGGEGTKLWTASTNFTAGAVISYQNNTDFTKASTTSFNLSASGDQIIAYTSADGGATASQFLFLVQSNSSAFQTSATNSNTSAIPNTLTEGVNAVAAGKGPTSGAEWDNVYYNGPRTGTAAELKTAIATASNWVGNNERVEIDTTPFTVAIPEPASLTLLSIASLLALPRRRK